MIRIVGGARTPTTKALHDALAEDFDLARSRTQATMMVRLSPPHGEADTVVRGGRRGPDPQAGPPTVDTLHNME